MTRRILLVALAIGLASALAGCRDGTPQRRQVTGTRKAPKRGGLINQYDPKNKVKQFIQASKGEGEGAKVKVHAGPSDKELVIGQLNFGTTVEKVSQYRGWWGIRYYNRDGGEFYGWIRQDQARHIGSTEKENEVIAVEDDYRKKHLTLQESDEELALVLAVPYRLVDTESGSAPKKIFWGSADPEGTDDIALLGRMHVTSETKAWVRARMAMLSELATRAHRDYVPVLKAYYDALQWYAMDEKARFVQALKGADARRNEFTRHFGR